MADKGYDDPVVDLNTAAISDEETRERVFRFAIDKISTMFEIKMERCFLEFEIGGLSMEDETDKVIESKKMKKVKNADGTTEEREVMETVNCKMTRIKKTPVMRYMTYQKRAIKAKSNDKFSFDRIDGYWYGSYRDLHAEQLTVRVWSSRIIGGNVLIGEAREPFINIADSKVDRILHVKRRSGAAREELVCELRFKCEFQEWFNFQVKFQNWELSYTKEEMEKRVAEVMSRGSGAKEEGGLTPGQAKCLCYSTDLRFHVRRSRQDLKDSIASLFCACCSGDSARLMVRDNLKTPAGSGKDAVAIVSYPGTRNWLEDEELLISWRKRVLCGIGCCATDVAATSVPLQGTLDYGYILAPLAVRKDACSCYCMQNSCKQGCLSLFSSLQCCFGPTCNCCRDGYSCLGCELSPEEKLQEQKLKEEELAKHYMNMSIAGVVTCDTMPRYRQQGTVDPVRRSGLLALAQNSDQSTFLVCKIVRAKGLSCESEFKEMINPSVSVEWSGIQKRTKVIHNTTNPYWDYDVHFKIPDKNGAPRKFEDFPEPVRNSKLVLTVWDEDGLSRASLGYAEVDFRTIYEKRVEKNIQVFSSDTRVPHLVYEAKLALDMPYSDASEDKKTRESKRLLEAEHKYLEVIIYFDRVDTYTIDNRRIAYERRELTLAQKERLRIQQFSRARVLWDESLRHVDNKESRFFTFFGKDEYTGDFHFLPTFMKPMHPPANMKDMSEIFYYVFSIEVQQKPPVEIDDAKRKRALRLKDPCSPILYNDVWVWADPFFFFEKKKGDIKDHCVLLCNFLLGLGLPRDQFNAFVCIGTARSKKAGKPVPHVWVMTQELFPHQAKPIVRFWELKTGETIALEGPRFEQVYNPDTHRTRHSEDKFVPIDPSGNVNNLKPEDMIPDPEIPGEEKVKDLGWDKVGRRMNEELAQFDFTDDAALLQLTTETGAGMLGMPAVGVGLGSSNGVSEETDVAGGVKGNALQPNEVRVQKSTTTNVYTSAASAEVDDIREGARHRQLLLQEFIREQETRFPSPKDHFWDTSDHRQKRLTPYESVDVVFNHECLFGNLQQANPEVIMYEFEKEKRWIEFSPQNWRECFGYSALMPFYDNKAIVSVLAPEREINMLKAEMTMRLKENLITHRSYHHQYETIFFDKFEFSGTVVGLETAADYAKQRLDLESKYGMRDEGLRALDAIRATTEATDTTGEKEAAASVGKVAQKLRSKVQRNLKDGLEYQERLFHFKHTDANRIGDQIKAQCSDILAFPDGIAPRFQIFLDIERLPGQVCPVRVLMMVMYGHSKQ